MPNSIIAAIALSEHVSPLRSRKTGVMIRFAFSVMRLRDSDQSLGLTVESLTLTLLRAKLRQFRLRQSYFIHRPLPTALTPSSKILINTLALQPIESGHRDDVPRAPSIGMMIQRDQRVTTDDRSRDEPIEKSTERPQQVRVITKWFRLAVLFGHQGVEQKQRPTWNFAASADQKPFEIFRTPA